MNKAFISLFALLILSACMGKVEQRGNLPNKAQVNQLKVGQTTKDQAVAILGSPNSLSSYFDQTWYYISQEVRRRPILPPAISRQIILSLSFDGRGILSNAKVLTRKDGVDISPNKRQTTPIGQGFSLFDSLFGGLSL